MVIFSSLTLWKQPVKQKKNSELKLAAFHLEINFVSHTDIWWRSWVNLYKGEKGK